MENQTSLAFGKKTSFEEAQIIILPVPWEVTASYGMGTSEGPELIRRASAQMDFFQKSTESIYNDQIHFCPEDSSLRKLNQEASLLSKDIQDTWTETQDLNSEAKLKIEKINTLCKKMVDWVYQETRKISEKGKCPVVVGGDHSVSEGILKFMGEKYQGDYGILHIDAHKDLRLAYQGFTHSHASVMNNVMNQKMAPKKLVQVGIRDFSKEEYHLAKKDSRIICYYDEDLSLRLFQGDTWSVLCKEIVASLPSQVYISLDIDGLSWEWSRGTGTPVPGGLSFNQSLFLFQELKRQNKKIIGFDLVETSSGEIDSASCSIGEWSGNVSARLIYYLSGLVLETSD